MEQRMLLVHAHPDDESINHGATMAKYVARGTQVTLVTCTLGEEGEVLVPGLEHLASDQEDRLGLHRVVELAEAMKELGVTDHRFLGGQGKYRDSGMVWHEQGHATAGEEVKDGTFWRADLLEAATDLVSVIREVRPQVLVTYDQFGNYGHPDHIQAHRVAMYAVQLAAARSYREDLGDAWEVAKIYWAAMSENRMREGLRRLRASGDTTTFEGMDPDADLGFWVTPDRLLDCVGGRQRLRRGQARRDARPRHADHRRRTVLRAVQQHRQRGVGQRVLPAREGREGPGRRRRTGDGPLRRARMRLLVLLVTLVLGFAAGVAAIAVHRTVPGLLLGTATAVAVILALRPWQPRASAAFAAGWLVALVAAVAGRSEGDYVVSADLLGWLLIGSGFVVLVTGITAARPLPRRRDAVETGDRTYHGRS